MKVKAFQADMGNRCWIIIHLTDLIYEVKSRATLKESFLVRVPTALSCLSESLCHYRQRESGAQFRRWESKSEDGV